MDIGQKTPFSDLSTQLSLPKPSAPLATPGQIQVGRRESAKGALGGEDHGPFGTGMASTSGGGKT